MENKGSISEARLAAEKDMKKLNDYQNVGKHTALHIL